MEIRELPSVNGRPILDANHIGPIVLIFIPTFLCPAGLLVISTIVVRQREGASASWTWTNPTMWDFLGLACMLSLSTAWSTVVCVQTQVGLGTNGSPDDAAAFQKYEYASELLYLLAIMFWKCTNGLCNSLIFGSTVANTKRRLQSTTVTAVITLFFLGALFAAAFQCHGPDYWRTRGKAESQCFNRTIFWAIVGAFDILSDIILHGLLVGTIHWSQMVAAQKRVAFTIIGLYLVTYICTASVRLTFVVQSYNSPNYALLAARTALSTFSQLIFPMSVLCIGKLSKFLDLESYLSPAIGADSRTQKNRSGKGYYLPHDYGQNSANASGPNASQRAPRRTFGDSVEELPLTTISKDREQSSEGDGFGDVITVKRDVTVRSERGHLGTESP